MIHSCSYYCHRPECIKAQRDELRDKFLNREWVGLTDEDLNQWTEEEHDVLRWAEAKLKEKNT